MSSWEYVNVLVSPVEEFQHLGQTIKHYIPFCSIIFCSILFSSILFLTLSTMWYWRFSLARKCREPPCFVLNKVNDIKCDHAIYLVLTLFGTKDENVSLHCFHHGTVTKKRIGTHSLLHVMFLFFLTRRHYMTVNYQIKHQPDLNHSMKTLFSDQESWLFSIRSCKWHFSLLHLQLKRPAYTWQCFFGATVSKEMLQITPAVLLFFQSGKRLCRKY